MSRTVSYDIMGNEVYDDVPTQAQEELEYIDSYKHNYEPVNLFDYTGQERDARKLLIDEKIAPIEDVAIMSGKDVEEKIRERYEVVAKANEEILLVKKEDMEQFEKFIKILTR